MIGCPSCLREVSKESRFCSHCGLAIQQPSQSGAARDPGSESLDKLLRHIEIPGPAGSKTESSPHAPPLFHRDQPDSRNPDRQTEHRFETGTILLDRFRIVGLLGKGGMGEVYKAEDLKLDQSVALKFLPRAWSSGKAQRDRLLKEVRVGRQVSHPHVCRLHDLNEVDGELFISMECVDGETLSSLVRRIGSLPRKKANEISRQLCAGLAAAHAKGILHRDLKPQNVMIDGRGKAIITDFGLAGFEREFVPGTPDLIAGTPSYMAPEQFEGREVTVRSDLYSLGLVLYFIFAGEHAFEPGTTTEIRKRRQEGLAAAAGTLAEGLDPSVERLILGCISHDPSDRPPSALAVASLLPGMDALSAAIEAGQTPMPEVVASAGGLGVVSLKSGLSLLAAVLCAMAILAMNNDSLSKDRLLVPVGKAPAVLTDRAQELIRQLGYETPPVDWTSGIGWDNDFRRWLDHQAPTALKHMTSSEGYFWYRQTAGPLESASAPGTVTQNKRATNENGIITITLDPGGRLTRFEAPPDLERPLQGSQAQVRWDRLFQAAGLDPTHFESSPSSRGLSIHADVKLAWRDIHPRVESVPVQVETASWLGMPVYFRTFRPWEEDHGSQGRSGIRFSAERFVNSMFDVLRLVVIPIAVILAALNYRRRRCDLRGAVRLGAALFGLKMMSSLLRAKHTGLDGSELRIWVSAIQVSTFLALLCLAFYLAIEPHMRRVWPEMIIGWTRLVRGDWSDPLVGRDVLIGSFCGVVSVLCVGGLRLVARAFELSPPTHSWLESPDVILSTRGVVIDLLGATEFGFQAALWHLFILAVVLLLIPKRTAAMIVFAVINFLVNSTTTTSGHTAMVLASSAIMTALTCLILLRFGLLPLAVATSVFFVLYDFPPTFDGSAWHTGNVWLTVSFVIGLAAWACWTALGGLGRHRRNAAWQLSP